MLTIDPAMQGRILKLTDSCVKAKWQPTEATQFGLDVVGNHHDVPWLPFNLQPPARHDVCKTHAVKTSMQDRTLFENELFWTRWWKKQWISNWWEIFEILMNHAVLYLLALLC